MTRLSVAACGLERLQAERRAIGAELLYLDGYDRWGQPDDREGVWRQQSELGERRRHVVAELERRVRSLRASDPSHVIAWAEAHRALLSAYADACRAKEPAGEQSTERFVAEGEMEAWAKVASGEADSVDENTYYVSVDASQYEALFGFPPR